MVAIIVVLSLVVIALVIAAVCFYFGFKNFKESINDLIGQKIKEKNIKK